MMIMQDDDDDDDDDGDGDQDDNDRTQSGTDAQFQFLRLGEEHLRRRMGSLLKNPSKTQ